MLPLLLGVALANPLTPTELLQRKPAPEPVEVTGWVARAYVCPACPEGAQCKPCMGNNVVLSDREETLTDWNLMPHHALIFTGELAQPAAGAEVTVSVEVREGTAPNGSAFHAVLVERKPTPGPKSADPG